MCSSGSRRLWVAILTVLVSLLVSYSSLVHAFPLEREARLADFDYLFAFLEENYPFFGVVNRLTGADWRTRREEFRQWVASAEDDRAFAQAIARIVRTLHNGHTHLVPPDRLGYYQDLYRGTELWPDLFTPEVEEAAAYWQEVLAQDAAQPSFLARYVAGDYYVSEVDPRLSEQLPVGSRLLAVNGQPIDEYVFTHGDDYTLQRDPIQGKIYAWQFFLRENGEVTVENQNGQFDTQVPGHLPDAERATSIDSVANVTARILADGEIAYLRVRSFASQLIDQDRQRIADFLGSVADYPHLIIDIRGNGGGSERYWRNLLVEPLLAEGVILDYHLGVRSGKEAITYAQKRMGTGYHFMQADRGYLQERIALPPELLTPEFTYPLKTPRFVRPQRSVGFSGEIYLLVDDQVYSAAEGFAAFAKDSGWATLVGTHTGGDGIGFDPGFLVLPHSKLVIRLSMVMGLHPDGSINEEEKTAPDVFVPGSELEWWRDSDPVLAKTCELIAANYQASDNPSVQTLSTYLRNYLREVGAPPTDRIRSADDWRRLNELEGRAIAELKIYGALVTDHELLREVAEQSLQGIFRVGNMLVAENRLNMAEAHRSIVLDARPTSGDSVLISIFVREGHRYLMDNRRLVGRIINDVLNDQISFAQYNIKGKMQNLTAAWGWGAEKQRILQWEGISTRVVPKLNSLTVRQRQRNLSVEWGGHAGEEYSFRQREVDLSSKIYLSPSDVIAGTVAWRQEQRDTVQDSWDYSLSWQRSTQITGDRGEPGTASSLTAGIQDEHPYLRGSWLNRTNIASAALQLSAAAGWMSEDTPVTRRFLLGGRSSFAAYGDGRVPALRFWRVGAELQIPGRGYLKLVTFADGGQVWDQGHRDYLASVGAGLLMESPIGLDFRLDYARSPLDWQQQQLRWGFSARY